MTTAPPAAATDVTTVIDFDDAGGGVSLPVDTYASLGVHIADAWVWRGGSDANYPYRSGVQRVFPDWIKDPGISAIAVTFDQAVGEVGAWFAGPAETRAWFTCADGSGTTVATSGDIALNGASYVYKSVTASGIRSCSFTGDNGGKSFVMDDLTFITPGVATVPAAPAVPSAVPGNGQVELTWTAPEDGGSAITWYSVAYKAPTDLMWTNASFAAGTLSHTFVGLVNGTAYEFKVRAYNTVGWGAYSDLATATPVAPVTVPAAPGAPSATPGDGQVELTWSAPDNGGADVSGYTVAYKTAAALGWTTTTSATTSKTIAGLTNGTTYQFKVLAHNSAGDGPYSDVTTATPVAPATALTALADLRADVVALDLGKSASRLLSPLDRAVANVAAGKNSAALRQLSSFSKTVDGLGTKGVLSPTVVGLLNAQVTAISDML